MKEIARAFSKNCKDQAWDAEFYRFGDQYIIRWASTMEITILHLKDLISFYADTKKFKNRIIEVHTGAHCTEAGNIGTVEPKFSLADTQLVVDKGIKGGVYQVNGSSDPPTYSY